MDKDALALALLAQVHRLNGTGPAAVRVILRSAEGEYLGEAALNGEDTRAVIESVQAVADHNDYAPNIPYTDGLDPLLVADIEDHFASIDPAAFLGEIVDAADEEAAIRSYEALVLGTTDEDGTR
ncbi:hypothetical protein [Streptomyces sp. NPDC058657]|uniref:hypothetical protein n=1 Tax=unclassified Streptomyces TaxID=2593676 RepID=UPI00365D8F13